MQEYIFLHGRNASLSSVEIKAVFEKEVRLSNPLFSVIATNQIVDQKLLNTFGGIVQIAEIITQPPVDAILENAQNKKIMFGVSQYGGHEPLSKVLLNLKKTIRLSGKNVRFVNKNFKNLSSAQIRKSGLLEKGIALIRIFAAGKEQWGKIIAVQDIDAYSERDFGKPCRDMSIGMMPPKLAQIMINLAKPFLTTTIYDPFCGFGTVLLEACLRENSILGSDLKGTMIEATKKNLLWLQKQYALPFPATKEISEKYLFAGFPQASWHGPLPQTAAARRGITRASRSADARPAIRSGGVPPKAGHGAEDSEGKISEGNLSPRRAQSLLWTGEQPEKRYFSEISNQIFQHDARDPIPRELPEDVAIVTEGYLGPPLTFLPNAQKQNKILETIHDINSKFLSQIRQKIRKGNRVVICVPFFKIYEKNILFPKKYLDQYASIGFQHEYPPTSLLYDRVLQKVGRQILVLVAR